MKMLVDEGLLFPLTFTQDQNQLKALTTAELATVGVVPSGSASVFGVEPRILYRMELLEPLTGPGGVSTAPISLSQPQAMWFITKDAADPELAFRVGDFFYSYDSHMVARRGIKGEHWTDDPEILKDYLPAYGVMGYPMTFVAGMLGTTQLWNQPQNIHWQSNFPQYIPLEIAYGGSFAHKDDPDLAVKVNQNPIHLELYGTKVPDEIVSKYLQTADELARLGDIQMVDYVMTSATEFITGNRSLDQWDAYLNELERMGLQEFITIRQAGFDRAQ